jgi:hypothetical protein
MVSEPDGIVNVSPIATVFDAVSALEPRNVPEDTRVQNETCEYVSAVLTLSQTTCVQLDEDRRVAWIVRAFRERVEDAVRLR